MPKPHPHAALLHAIAEGRDLKYGISKGAYLASDCMSDILNCRMDGHAHVDPDEDNDLYIEGVIRDMISHGHGATEDHDDIKAFFRRVGFSHDMACRLHLMIATEFGRPAREGNPHEKAGDAAYAFDPAYAFMERGRWAELPGPVTSPAAAQWDTLGKIIESRNAIALEVKQEIGAEDVKLMISFVAGVKKLADVPADATPWLTYRLGMLMGKKKVVDHVAALDALKL